MSFQIVLTASAKVGESKCTNEAQHNLADVALG
jgi:hypothetical protein